ncbi:MAG: chromosome segregation protein SMC [Deltaproteobacteria bacterium]|nr:MAG: chromosome segregation protein SMC [Deltaproteobacteria bacterium]
MPMRIKRLSIQGFKSFMDRLEISFPPGISGVVGPNGCGKSNIVDAIRWCMGEQSPKLLRGRRMEDVIFNGAGKEKAMGMAEVSLVFENGDGSFPSAFSDDPELSVTRRLFRSGESEYYINRMPCRLKDIQEIFMDTGLGNRAYSIIGQGQIGNIIEQRPEETRLMLEEAAGITKYRKKVEASQRKIELTERNLQRVEDILGEVQKQMRSLKRQASKAKRYKAVCERIREIELTLYANTYRQLKEEAGDRLRLSDDLVRQETEKSTALSALQARIEALNLQMEEKNAAHAGRQEKYMKLREDANRKEASLEALSGEIRMQADLETRLRSEQEEIRHRLRTLEEEKAALREKMERMDRDAERMAEEITVSEQRMKSRRQFLARVRSEYEEARSRLNAGVNKEVGLSHESDYLGRMLGQITDSRSRLEKERREVDEKIETLVAASRRKSAERETAADRLAEIRAAIEQQGMVCEELERDRDRVEREYRSAETELNVCASRLASLVSLAENFEGYQMGVRTVMKARDLAPREKGRVLGLLADVIRVAPEHEQAVEAVLAERLQYVIVRSQEDGRDAVDYLKRRARGRSSFVPLDDLKPTAVPGGSHAGLPRLSELVSVPSSHQPLVNGLLGDTVMVHDLEQALNLWKNDGTGVRYVTPEGDMVDQNGVITGGRLTKSSRGLLARRREIAELKETSAGLEKNLNRLKERLEDVDGEIRQKKADIERLTEERWDCQEELNEFDKKIFRLGQELDQLEKISRKISDDLKRKDVEQRKHERELSRITAELNDRKEKRRREEAYFQEKETELRESEEEFDQFRDELAGLKGDFRILKEGRRGLLREIEMKDDFSGDARSRLEKIEDEIARGNARQAECREKTASLKAELAAVFDRLKASEEDVIRAERDRQAFQETIRLEEKKAKELQEEIEALRDRINRARMKQSEIRFQMDNLASLAREKANVDLGAVYEQYRVEEFSADRVEEALEQQKALRQRIGEVNLTAIKEHAALKERYEFIKTQREDLVASIEALRSAIQKINRTSVEKFRKTFQEVDQKLKQIFPILFNGGSAGLRLVDETRPLESGVLVEVKPPGKKLSHMGLLSGGEKALVAMALIFAIYMIRPSPFCVLDEVDAPLDEANIDRFNNLLEEIRKYSQIIVVTHSRKTMEIVDRLYGITMENAGISKTVSVDIQGGNRPKPAQISPARPVSLN